MWLGHRFQGQKVKGQLVADVVNSQHAGTGAIWRICTKILSTCRGGGISWRPLAYSLLQKSIQFLNWVDFICAKNASKFAMHWAVTEIYSIILSQNDWRVCVSVGICEAVVWHRSFGWPLRSADSVRIFKFPAVVFKKFSFSLKFFHQFPDFLTPKLFL